ncbi:hypothetical protein ACFPFP_02305 [Bradyrhizobium sp. GCM10023182]|uniref:CopG family transcriptional regulator n=1 Tax=Bradyrhizobium zhengyangense TaxID=2911009 RepID=A0ABS9LFJ0_9BRAD|nr:hypothetical protein [Bradyrhizobium zhengyangense]MCG2665761.1 hypothetical protein [Bradyrhizobium zhengyangense]
MVSYLTPEEQVVREPKKKASKARVRKDKRSQLLIYMFPSVIRQLKLAALAKGQPSYELAEEAIKEWLENHQDEIRQGTAKISRGE